MKHFALTDLLTASLEFVKSVELKRGLYRSDHSELQHAVASLSSDVSNRFVDIAHKNGIDFRREFTVVQYHRESIGFAGIFISFFSLAGIMFACMHFGLDCVWKLGISGALIVFNIIYWLIFSFYDQIVEPRGISPAPWNDFTDDPQLSVFNLSDFDSDHSFSLMDPVTLSQAIEGSESPIHPISLVVVLLLSQI